MTHDFLPEWLCNALQPKADVPVPWLRERFALLFRAQCGDFKRDAAIVPKLGSESKLVSVGMDGGSDARFVMVFTRTVPSNWHPGIQEWLTYGPNVAGTDLIYDLTGEFLQGKARPFLADFRRVPVRFYVVLPFQIERIDLAAQQQVLIPTVPASCFGFEMAARLRFLNGAGEMIRSRLPYHVEMKHMESDVVGGMYLFTRPEDGYPKGFCVPVKNLDGRWALTVRSLLTGDEAILPFEVSHVSGRFKKSDTELTSDGLRFRRAPQPVG